MNNNMLKPAIMKPAIIGGMALGIPSALPGLNLCNVACCAWAIAGGILAAYLCIKDSPFPLTMGRGAVTGLATGAIGAVVWVLFFIPVQFITSGGGSEAIQEHIREMLANNPEFPPETILIIEDLFARGDILTLIAVFIFVFNFIFFSLFAMLGGAIGVAIFEKRKPDAFIPPPPGTWGSPPHGGSG